MRASKTNGAVALISMICLFTVSLMQPATAAVIGTSDLLRSEARQAQVEDIQRILQRDRVRAQLLAFGVAPEDVMDRVAALTDEEITELQARIEQLPAGAGALELIGAVFLILLILEVVGVINIFNKV